MKKLLLICLLCLLPALARADVLTVENGTLVAVAGAGLTSVTLPADVKTVAPEAFADCAELTEILVAPGNASLQAIDGVLFNAKGNTLFAYPRAKEGAAYALPDGVKTIAARAFEGNLFLESVALPASLRVVAERAFCGAARLKSINLPRGVTSLGERAFAACPALESVRLSERFYVGGAYAFADCPALASADVPEGCRALGEGMFQNCAALANVLLSQDIELLPARAFESCVSLETLLLPDHLLTIGDRALFNCVKLSTLFLPSKLINLGWNIFSPEYTAIEVYRYNETAMAYCRAARAKYTVTTLAAVPRSLTLSAPATLCSGQSAKITAGGAASARELTFSCDNPLLTVDADGRVTAGEISADGIAVVTAVAPGGVRARVEIALSPKKIATHIEIVPLPGDQLKAGENAPMKAVVYPLTVSQNVDWTSSDESVVHIGFSKTAYAQNYVRVATQVTLTAHATDGSGVTGTYTLTVVP